MTYKLRWTEEAVQNLKEILNYLNKEWSNKEVENFKERLRNHLYLMTRFPLMFPVSQFNSRLRKAVLSKQTTIFFELKNNTIFLVHIFINRKNIERIK